MSELFLRCARCNRTGPEISQAHEDDAADFLTTSDNITICSGCWTESEREEADSIVDSLSQETPNEPEVIN